MVLSKHMQTPHTRGLPRARSRGFISLGLILLLILGLAAFGGAGWWVAQNETSKNIDAASNPTGYREINKAFGVDATHVYVFGGIGKSTTPTLLEDVDMSTFVSTGDYTAKDKNHTYGLNSRGYLVIDGRAEGPPPPSQ